MNEILQQYKNYLTATAHSLHHYNFVKPFILYCEKKGIDIYKLTATQIMEFLNTPNSRGKIYSINSKNSFKASCKHFYDFLKITPNIWQSFKYLKTEQRIPDYLKELEIGQIVAKIKTYHGRHYGLSKVEALLLFIFYSGARRGEIMALKRQDIDIDNCIAKVYGKNRKERYIYFPESLQKILQKYFDSELEKENAFNITRGRMDYLFQLLTHYLPNKKIYPHLLRHSGARNMMEKGIDITIIKDILGHSDIATTQIYTRQNQKGVQNIYNDRMNKEKKV